MPASGISGPLKLDKSDPSYQEGEAAPRKRSPGRKVQSKHRRKHDRDIEGKVNVDDEVAHSSLAGEWHDKESSTREQETHKIDLVPSVSDNLDPLLEQRQKRDVAETSLGGQHDSSERNPFRGILPPQQVFTEKIATRPLPSAQLESGHSLGRPSPPTSPRAAFRQPISAPDPRFLPHFSHDPPFNQRSDLPPLNHAGRYDARAQNPRGAPTNHADQGAMPTLFDEISESSQQYWQSLDSYTTPCGNRPRTSEILLLRGIECGLDFHRLERMQLHHIGRLANLRGNVVGANFLRPLVLPFKSSSLETIVLLILHGPIALEESIDRNIHPGGIHTAALHSTSPPQGTRTHEPGTYQTTVELWSLSTGRPISTLYKSAPIDARPVRYGTAYEAPDAASLSIKSEGRYILVISGESGEVFVFERLLLAGDSEQSSIRFIGKCWTQLQVKRHRSSSISSRDSATIDNEEAIYDRERLPICALSMRWLAVVSPQVSSQSSVHGTVPGWLGTRVPGSSTHAAPLEPRPTCQLDIPGGESLMNRIAWDATQEVVKGARWVGSQGVQAWNTYWSKPVIPSPQSPSKSPFSHGLTFPAADFPPTHAYDTTAVPRRHQAATVSIIDLHKLAQNTDENSSQSPVPLAAFKLPDGCSILSFNPNGLQLLSANGKGDVQQIWDMLRMTYGDSQAGLRRREAFGPRVREVARFTRMTETQIMDLVWTCPDGERFAMLTDHGTIHIYDIPSSALHWPPSHEGRRVLSGPINAVRSLGQDQHDGNEDEDAGGSALSSALSMLSATASPLVSAIRARSGDSGQTFPNTLGRLASTATGSGKNMAASLNRSVAAVATGTVSTLRHLGENRINLPGRSRSARSGCLHWMPQGREGGMLAVTAGAVVRLHIIQSGTDKKGGKGRPSAVTRAPIELAIPAVIDGQSFWQADPPASTGATRQQSQRCASLQGTTDTHALSHAEIESNAPTQPLHTDRRMHMFHYEDGDNDDGLSAFGQEASGSPFGTAGMVASSAWAFGEPISATRVQSCAPDSTLLARGGGGGGRGHERSESASQVRSEALPPDFFEDDDLEVV